MANKKISTPVSRSGITKATDSKPKKPAGKKPLNATVHSKGRK